MPSLIALALLSLSFPSILCYAFRLPFEARDKKPTVKCQNKPYDYYPAGTYASNPTSLVKRGEPPGQLLTLPTSLLPPLPQGDPGLGKRDAIPADTQHPRIVLCTPDTETFIKLTRLAPWGDFELEKNSKEIQEQLQGLVSNSWSYIAREHLGNGHEDGVINAGEGWVYERQSTRGGYKLQVANSHHKKYFQRVHFGGVEIVGNEITWGVLRAALTAVRAYMASDKDKWTECEFQIWDGKNQVGTARIVNANYQGVSTKQFD
ncbi:MAG: hypothetical protein Q9219_001840 [cf. Caloplaca sp. 3 TL-2023]